MIIELLQDACFISEIQLAKTLSYWFPKNIQFDLVLSDLVGFIQSTADELDVAIEFVHYKPRILKQPDVRGSFDGCDLVV